MDTEIQTERLVLRSPTVADAPRITQLIADPRIHRNVGRIKAGQTEEETAERITLWQQGRTDARDFVYAITDDGDICGVAGGHMTESGAFDIGYWIAPEKWGKGYATEAAGAIIEAAIRTLGAKAFTAGYIADNPPSGRVLRKLGFIPCGRSIFFVYGRQENCVSLDMALIV